MPTVADAGQQSAAAPRRKRRAERAAGAQLRAEQPVIRKPEMTKNTSTPTNPPPTPGASACEQNNCQHCDSTPSLDVGAKSRTAPAPACTPPSRG